MSSQECLLIGPSAGGKSLLLDKLRLVCSSDREKRSSPEPLSSSYTIPTIGVDVVSLSIPELKREITIREVGSSMTSQWYCMLLKVIIDNNKTFENFQFKAPLLQRQRNDRFYHRCCRFMFHRSVIFMVIQSIIKYTYVK
jgi:hypothetical protein